MKPTAQTKPMSKPNNDDDDVVYYPSAQSMSLVLCHQCGLLNSAHADAVVLQDHANSEHQHDDAAVQHCTRCHHPLHSRKPASLQRTLALMIAACILYIPANLLPMTDTESLLGSQQDTIMSGVIYFWSEADYLVAIVIFTASIFVPMLKLMILAFLLFAVHQQASSKWHFHPQQCSTLYRIVEFIGRWSMIDVFVVSMLTALVHMQNLANISAGPGAIAFAAVVVLTMLASMSFDPRIIWDNYYAIRCARNGKSQSQHSPANQPVQTLQD